MARLTRRQFLENSMFAALAASGAPLAASSLYAADEKAGPNDILRVAVLGVRGRGQEHFEEYIKHKETEVVAIVEPDSAIANARADKIYELSGKRPKIYTDLREAYDNQDIDVVSIATPNHWHALAAIWAMQAGKDVYVEKPVSHNVSEGRRIVQTARKYGKICQTGTQCRSMGGTIEAVEYVQAGKIGEMKLARGLCHRNRPSIGPAGKYDPPATVDYNIWAGPAPDSTVTRPRFHYDWHWQYDYGNGDLGNQGIHQMDIARWGLGVDGIGDSVVSYGGRYGYIDAGNTANTQVNLHTFGDKRLIFETRGLATETYRGAHVGVVFHGTDGYVVLDKYTRGAAFDPDGNQIQKFEAGGDHFGNFIEAVLKRDSSILRADIEEGHRSSALCHLGNISYLMGKPVHGSEAAEMLAGDDEAVETFERFRNHLADHKVDLSETTVQFGPTLSIDNETETFTGELASLVNPMLTREYRAPFIVPTEADV